MSIKNYSMKEIAVTTTTFGTYDDTPLELCRKNGLKIILNPYASKVTVNQFVELARNATGVIAGTELITEEALLKLAHLKVISRCGTGLDNIDLNAARKRGIKVFNTPDAPAVAVAELTVGLVLDLLRGITRAHVATKTGTWKKSMGVLLNGKRVGIIGFGRIGRKVAGLLKPFGCKTAYADPSVKNGVMGLSRLSLRNLLSWADIVSVHVSGKETVLGKGELCAMKKEAILVNTSRGEAIDEKALYNALKAGRLRGAAIDVFEKEPYRGPLRELDNIVLTPHIGSYARGARIEMEKQAVFNLLKGLGISKL